MYWFLTGNLDDMSLKELNPFSASSGKWMWTSGQRFEEPFPLEDFFVSTRVVGYDIPDGDDMPDLFDIQVPLMSTRLLETLKSAGIDNIDAYPVNIIDRDKGLTWDSYFAINIIGRVDALDKAKSITEDDDSNTEYISVVIDSDKTQNLQCFRLHKGPREMIIHDRVAKKIASMNFKGILLIRTEDFDETKY